MLSVLLPVVVLRGNILFDIYACMYSWAPTCVYIYIANNFALLLTLQGLLLVLEYLCHINVREASEDTALLMVKALKK